MSVKTIVNSIEHPCYWTHRRLNALWRSTEPSPLIATIATRFFWALTVLSTFGLTVLQFCEDSNEFESIAIREIAKWCYDHRLLASIVLGVIQIVCASGIAYCAWRTPFDADKLKKILNSIVEHCFPERDRHNSEYRATIFQIRGIWFLKKSIGQWAGIVSRSGENYDQLKTIFLIDRMSREKSTGIIGRCLFAEGQTVLLDELLPVDDEKEYKKICNLADVEYNEMTVKSKLVFATGIKRDGKLWGFLVLDTTDEDQLPNQQTASHKRRALGACAEIVGTLIS